MTRLNAEEARKLALKSVPDRLDAILARVQQEALMGKRHVDIYKADGSDLKPGKFFEQSPVTQAIVEEIRKLSFGVEFKSAVSGHAQVTDTYMRITW